MSPRVYSAHLICLAWLATVSAQTPTESVPKSEPVAESYDDLSARAAVRKGNARLLEGDSPSALNAYAHAKELRPEAPQIPFVQGLAHLAQRDFDAARDAFRVVAASDNKRLANDALYSLGASYHLEALENSENPEQAIDKLESAMARYREVLAGTPDHAAARESDYKAASMRRQLKQLLEQQQQEQQQQEQNEDGDQEDQDQQPSDQDQQQSSDEQQDDQQQSSDEGQQEEGDQEQQEQSGDESQEESEEDQQPAQMSEEEEISREQAERRLREMIQAIRERQKKRKNNVQKVPLPPVERDW